jgi:hypothetical protein
MPPRQARLQVDEWKPIDTAPKDGKTRILAIFHADIYPRIEPKRPDLKRWNGVQTSLWHPGVYEHEGSKWDHGWNVAAPVGCIGLPDEWIAGWTDLPPPPPKD